jgi:phosphate transport system substrate-binding protein
MGVVKRKFFSSFLTPHSFNPMKLTLITSTLALVFSASLSLSAQNVLRIRGSDTLGAKLVPQWAEAFKKTNPTVGFDIAAEGSSTAFTNLAAGTAEIGMSSRAAKNDEITLAKTKGVFLKEINVAQDLIAVILHRDNPIAELSSKQIAAIFTGAIKDWSEVGGTPGPISVYTRNTSSGTYKDWQKLAMDDRDYAADSQKLAGNEQIVQEVANNANGIGYVGLAYAHGTGIKAITVDGKEPNQKDAATYPYGRPNFFYINGDATGSVKAFLDFVLSAEGTRISRLVGFLPPVSP